MNTQKITIFALLLVVVSSCAQKAESTHSYEPLQNVMFLVNTKKLEYHADTKSVFLYFKLKIENRAPEDVYINVSNIQAVLNGELNERTYYDSLASVIPKEEKLEKGTSVWELYFVYSENLKGKKMEQFKITNYGLRAI